MKRNKRTKMKTFRVEVATRVHLNYDGTSSKDVQGEFPLYVIERGTDVFDVIGKLQNRKNGIVDAPVFGKYCLLGERVTKIDEM